jgi:hypothetical protein
VVARETVVVVIRSVTVMTGFGMTVLVAFMVAVVTVVSDGKLSPARLAREGHQGHPSHVEGGEKRGE